MKKNKLTIFLVAVILMLTVYYIKMPGGNEAGGTDGPDVVVVEKHADYILKRDEIIKSRTQLLDQLNLVLGNSDSSLNEKEVALETMQSVSVLTEKELVFEVAIVNLGYDDALCYVVNGYIKLNILTEYFTVEEFVEIAVLAKEQFGRNLTVTIEIDKPSQV